MPLNSLRSLRWILIWLALALAGALWLSQAELARLRTAFEAEAQSVHRLLSIRATEHEAILSTLALLDAPDGSDTSTRLPAIYPRILAVLRRSGSENWPSGPQAATLLPSQTALAAAEEASRRHGRAYGVVGDLESGRLWLVLASDRASHALLVDLAALAGAEDWPIAQDAPVRVAMTHAGHGWAVHDAPLPGGGWHFHFNKRLLAASQPFDVVAERRIGWDELPWGRMVAWALGTALLLTVGAAWQRQRVARRRAEELLRFGQVARLNALGELAAGMAHELNQPLTAILANTRAAARLLADEPPELGQARTAMDRAANQARRAADVLSRLRRTVERTDLKSSGQPVELRAATEAALHLMEPEAAKRSVRSTVSGVAAVSVVADPVALEQIIHNLLLNALQALEQVPAAERSLMLELGSESGRGRLTVTDTGPGIPDAVRARIFEPFFTTREQGLGLGLSLCETLASGMGGSLQVAPATPRGSRFQLTLPLAQP
ncbi:MAG: two-component sensor histidine kinase [Betaproteobacteria bacterium HGW-Betaproteobacteria-21]|nr:MAG: two-component sensor histidine kinase [Betaproteobacteria bacterium HGW-Betaproteobacteria-21]